MSAESAGWLEQFALRRSMRLAAPELAGIPARELDAMCVLEQEMEREKKDA